MNEKRAAPRSKVFKGGTVAIEGGNIPCTVRNMSSTGVAAEIAAFGSRTCAVFADEDSLRAFGPNPLDPRCRVPSARAGRAQGRRVAAAVTEFLG